MKSRLNWLAFGSALVLVGCTAHTALAPLDPSHPASPDAPEAPMPEPGTLLHQHAPSEGPPSPRQDHVRGGGARNPSSATKRESGRSEYTCPMHGDVRQPGPGRCPKCGMTLVPADDGEGEDQR